MKTEKLRILLVGYGKMGKAIETIAKERGHTISAIVSDKQIDVAHICKAYKPNMAFEFTSPSSAVRNLDAILGAGIPVVCGSTGWLEKWDSITGQVLHTKGSFLYSSNFSMGMNLMFKLAEIAGKFINELPEYEIAIEEIHHLEKIDKPSGTAITLAEKLLHEIARKKKWVLDEESQAEKIGIAAKREPNVPGTHTLTFSSAIDTIEMKHTAHSRMGFADGAVRAGEWLLNKKGVFTMEDFLAEHFGKK